MSEMLSLSPPAPPPPDDRVFLGREEMQENFLSSFEAMLNRLEYIWNRWGFSDKQRNKRINVTHQHFQTLINQIIQAEEDLHNEIEARIKNYNQQLDQLCKELCMSINELVPSQEGMPLLKLEELLRIQLDEMSKEKNSRERSLIRLRESERKLCALLGMPTLQLSSPRGIISKVDLQELEQHVEMLKKEKEQRLAEFRFSKIELTTIIELTEISPMQSFESRAILNEDDNFVLSQKNMEEMKDLLEKARKKMNEMEQELSSLKDRLETLWDRLNINPEQREIFLSNNKTNEYKLSTIQAFQQEISRCEELKRHNLKQYVLKMRNELLSWWDKCCVSQTERELFLPFFDDYFTEELLDLHDAEVQKVKEFYEETKDIFVRIKRRQELWNSMIVFEKRATDPNRFNNRGGALLQEEKERNRLLKELPKLEIEILSLIEEYEGKSSKVFTVNGSSFQIFIENEWTKHKKEKEDEKSERKLKAKQNEQNPGTSIFTPGKKRTITTPITTPSKFRRMNTGMSLRTPGSISRQNSTASFTPCVLKSANKTAARKSPRMALLKKNSTPKRHVLAEKNEMLNIGMALRNAGSISTYSEFSENLRCHQEKGLNSTGKMVPESEAYDYAALDDIIEIEKIF